MEKINQNNIKDIEQEHAPKGKEVSFSVKRSVIPNEWKDRIDTIIADELVGANRYYANANPSIAELIKKSADADPVYFLEQLTERWNWHHDFYEKLLEPSLSYLLEGSVTELSVEQVEAIIKIYPVCSLVDQATLIFSAGIKQCVENAIRKYYPHLTEEEKMFAISSPVESFWIQYRIDHLDYLISKMTDDPGTLEKETKLLNTYHIGDPEIFQARLKRFEDVQSLPPEKIRDEIEKLRISETYKSNHFCFTLESPRLKAIRDLLNYDNVEEYRIMKNLIGVSGFILRKKVISYLKEAKLIDSEVGIYDIDDKEIVRLLEKLRRYREEFSDKRVAYYRQTGDTCGAVCLMIAEGFLLNKAVNEKREKEVHLVTKSSLSDGNVFSLMAKQAVSEGLESVLVHSNEDLFNNDADYFEEQIFDKLMVEYTDSLEEGKSERLEVKKGLDIDEEMLVNYLKKSYLLIIAVQKGRYLHSILISGFNKDYFIVEDPLFPEKKYSIEKKDLLKFIKTPIGSWFLAVRRNKEALNNLLGKAKSFSQEAREYMQ